MEDVLLAVGRMVMAFSIVLGPLVGVLMLLNRRDRRELKLREAVLEQLAWPELRGRIAVQIRCAVFSRRSMVTVDMLACASDEVWDLFTWLSATLPPYARLRVQGAIDREFARTFTLETTTRHPIRRPPRASLVTG